ncbi:MAG: hypothetical protein M3Q88_00910 [Pseudomonadota bacterium]|nr:hypothetical protein [Pseudomonadota bacterium]
MRFLLFSVLALTACSEKPTATGLATGLFAGEGRDALCIVGVPGEQRAGFIVYGEGNVNCSARGTIAVNGNDFILVPSGEGDCRIPLQIGRASVVIGHQAAGCDYYCGPAVRFGEKKFGRVDRSNAAAARTNPMVDVAGDPLC